MRKAGRRPPVVVLILAFALIQSILCGSEASAMGRRRQVATVTPTPAPPASVNTQPLEGADPCVSPDSNHICIGLKLTSYEKDGVAVLTKPDAITLVREMNTI